MKPVKFRKLIKKKQPQGPWWFCVTDGDKLVSVSTATDLSDDFIKWVTTCHLAGLEVDLVTEASAVGVLRRQNNETIPRPVRFRDIQP